MKKIIIVLLFLVFTMTGIKSVNAKYSIDANSYGANLTSCRAYSSRTGKGYFACLINSNDMGYRVTIINKNGIRVSSKSIDLFSKEAYDAKKANVLEEYNIKKNQVCNNKIFGETLCKIYTNTINSMVNLYKDGYLLTAFGSINMKSITNAKYKSNNSSYFGSTTTTFARIDLGAHQKLNSAGNGISGFATMKNKIVKGTLFTTILNKLGVSKQDFINNEYKILFEPLYMISYTPYNKQTDNPVDLTQNDIDESNYYYGTANEVAKFLYDELENKKSYVTSTNYLNGILVNFIPNLAFNLHTNDVVEGSIIGYSTQNYTPINHYNLVYANLKKLYTTYGYGIGVISYNEIPNNGSLVIIKQDESGKQINKKAIFRLYRNSNCIEKNKFSSDISVTGSLNKILVPGNYSVKEITAPDGYIKDSTCHNFTIKSPVTSPTFVRVKNKIRINGCEAEFQGISNNRYARIQLYDKYPKNTNLLNFSIKDAKTACSPATCSSNPTASCFGYSYKINNFSKDNLSCATIDHITDSSKTGATHTVFCGVDYSLDNSLNLNSNNLATVQPGMMVLNLDKDSVVAKLNLEERCYIYYSPGKINAINDFKNAYQDNQVIIDTDPEITLDSQTLPMLLSNPTLLYDNNTANNYIERKYTAHINYYLNPVYATIGMGEICTTNDISDDCRLLGYGFISKLNAKDYSETEFTIDTKFHDTEVAACTYKISSELPIKNLEFRSVSKSNPFTGKNGAGRKTGSNWCNGADCSSTNETVKNIILDKNDSYNSTGDGPIYRIELKPKDIKHIRENYNDKKYDEFYLDCDQNATNCKSLLLENLNIIRLK